MAFSPVGPYYFKFRDGKSFFVKIVSHTKQAQFDIGLLGPVLRVADYEFTINVGSL